MKTETGEKGFDCVKWTRSTRDRISAEIRDMSYEELRQWLDAQVQQEPFFARIPNARKPARPPMEQAGVREAGSSSVTIGDGTRG